MQNIRSSIIRFILLAFVPALVLAQTGPARIRSPQELTRYLSETPAGTSPLDALSPGGRKRFLAQLVFGKRGLRSFSVDDPNIELRHAQVVQLFALFDVEALATGVGASKEGQARLQRERIVDATTRGCDIEACPQSDIEQRYDELVLNRPSALLPDDQRVAEDERHFDRLFKNPLVPSTLATTSGRDVRLLKRAVEFAQFYSPSQMHIAQLRTLLDDMQQRRMVDDKDYENLY